jgi:diphthamide synthase (EF-2-diphthine--ammonia ligase)
MADVCARARRAGVDAMAFGDLFLPDIRSYRERQLRGTGLEPLFPLWNLDTWALARAMIAGGLRAKLTCVDPKRLSLGFAGRDFDEQFLSELPLRGRSLRRKWRFHSRLYAAPF